MWLCGVCVQGIHRECAKSACQRYTVRELPRWCGTRSEERRKGTRIAVRDLWRNGPLENRHEVVIRIHHLPATFASEPRLTFDPRFRGHY
jgi:hypothetical protein